MFFRLCILFLLSMGVALAPASFEQSVAAATKKKVTHKRSDFTPEQRAKFMEEARKICRKEYGAMSSVYKIDYTRMSVICFMH